MHLQTCTLVFFSLTCYFSSTLADRGNNPVEITPTVCNNSPDAGVATATSAPDVRKRVVRRDDAGGERTALPARSLGKRSGTVNCDPNCRAAPPAGSKYGSGFPTMQSSLEKTYTDAYDLANEASVIHFNSPAYTHYFGPDPGQSDHFERMMTQIADSVNFLTVIFECSRTAGSCGATQDIVASTDATAGGAGEAKVINICPVFWTSAQTRYFLYDETKGPSPGVPYRDNSASGWCNNNLKSNFYATAGHTILHELTHLDALTSAAGLTAPDDGEDAGLHGTGDYQTGCELSGARDYLTASNADPDLPTPDYNAESYAAAATELYWMNQCSFDETPQ